jgi:predicted nucleic acid-binding protein
VTGDLGTADEGTSPGEALLVFDASPLSHFARADRLDALTALVKDYRCVTTRAVRDELERGVTRYPQLTATRRLDWLTEVAVDGLAELGALAAYLQLLSRDQRHFGEATVLAWAETHGAIAVIDDQAAVRAGEARGVEVHGSLWLIIAGYRKGVLHEAAASELVDQLRDTEAWFPCDGETVFKWAREHGLL